MTPAWKKFPFWQTTPFGKKRYKISMKNSGVAAILRLIKKDPNSYVEHSSQREINEYSVSE